jgi:hypothetical protein
MNYFRSLWARQGDSLTLSFVMCIMPLVDWFRGQWKLVFFDSPVLSLVGFLIVTTLISFATCASVRWSNRRRNRT